MTIQKEYIDAYTEKRYEIKYPTLLTPTKKYYKYGAEQTIPLAQVSGESNSVLHLINQIVTYTAKVIRYDILSRYNDHTPIPSARNFHSVEIYFSYKRIIYRYNYVDHSLELYPSPFHQKDGHLYIWGIGDLFKLSRFYSEFSYFLVGLESGHMLYNLKMILKEEGVDATQFFDQRPADLEIINAINRKRCETSIFFKMECFVGDRVDDLTQARASKINSTYDKPKHSELKHLSLLNQLLTETQNDVISGRNFVINKIEVPRAFKSATMTRNAAHNMLGNMDIKTENMESIDLQQLGLQVERYKTLFDYTRHIQPVFILNHGKKCEVIINGDKTEIGNPMVLDELLHNDQDFFDLTSFKFITFFYSIEDALYEEKLSDTLLACGELMQMISLYFSERDFFFRPMKNHNDHKLKDIMNLNKNDMKILYFGAAGLNNINNLSFRLGGD